MFKVQQIACRHLLKYLVTPKYFLRENVLLQTAETKWYSKSQGWKILNEYLQYSAELSVKIGPNKPTQTHGSNF